MTLVLLSPISGTGARILADLTEWDGRRDMRNTGQSAGGLLYDVGYAVGPTWWVNGAAGTGYVDAVGACFRMTCGAATTVSIGSTVWSAMLQTDFSQYPATFTRFRRFTWRYVVELAGVAPVAADYWVGLHDVTNPGYLGVGGPGNVGVDLFFNGTLGRWQARSRLIKLGALVLGNVSSIGAATRFECTMVYTEARVPTLALLINGIVLQTYTGLAQLPQSSPLPYVPAGGFPASYGGSIGGTTFAGAAEGDLRIRQARYVIEDLAA